MQVGRGSGNEISLIGISRCDNLDWTLFSVLIVLCMYLTFIAMKMNCVEYEEKVRAGYSFSRGDQMFTYDKTLFLASIAFIVALLAVACGLGPALILVPVWT